MAGLGIIINATKETPKMAFDPFDDPLDLPDEPASSHAPARPFVLKHSNRKKYLFVGLAVFLALGIVFAVLKMTNKDKKPSTASSPAAATETKVVPKDIPDANETKQYENGPMGLTLTYPTTWTATETADSGVRIESPLFSYQNLDRNSISGNFRIYIRKGARPVDSKYIGRGVAIKPSEKLVYKEPAVGQRADTLLSLFGLDTSDNFAYFFVAGNFQLKMGETLGPDYGKEPETFIVAGGFSSKDLKDDMATNPVSVDLINTSNAYKQAIDIIKTLQLH